MNQRMPQRAPRGFTLIELLVTMAIIATIATLSVISFGAIFKDTRVSSGANSVLSAVAEARSIAIRTGQPTAVVFRAVWDPNNPEVPQYTEAVYATWRGEQEFVPFSSNPAEYADIFEIVPDVRPRRLPEGIKVAGPFYANEGFQGPEADLEWITQPEFQFTDPAAIGGADEEFFGQLIGVLFGSDGEIMTANRRSFAREAFVDFLPGDDDGDGLRIDFGVGSGAGGSFGPDFYHYNEAADETYISFVPFLAVYDDDEAREFQTQAWTTRTIYINELVGLGGYITQYADRIHFNRNTGVAMR
ncbi:MAG: Tfp pilus assembly protein FimT/FimU [Phycisphaerales bacterium]